jgi:hypothetical protein
MTSLRDTKYGLRVINSEMRESRIKPEDLVVIKIHVQL